jgi:hypothetical protein
VVNAVGLIIWGTCVSFVYIYIVDQYIHTSYDNVWGLVFSFCYGTWIMNKAWNLICVISLSDDRQKFTVYVHLTLRPLVNDLSWNKIGSSYCNIKWETLQFPHKSSPWGTRVDFGKLQEIELYLRSKCCSSNWNRFTLFVSWDTNLRI